MGAIKSANKVITVSLEVPERHAKAMVKAMNAKSLDEAVNKAVKLVAHGREPKKGRK